MQAISNENEIWKDVHGFEGFYQVSNFGNVRSVTRFITRSDGKTYLKKGKQLKSFVTNKGYEYVMLNDFNSKQHLKTVHRLVAQAFVDNPDNLAVVNHKDENKLNNAATNLEWCTQSYNMTYNQVNQRISNKLKGRQAYNAVRVIDESTGVIYSSKQQCAKECKLRWNVLNDMIAGKLHEVKGHRIRKLN